MLAFRRVWIVVCLAAAGLAIGASHLLADPHRGDEVETGCLVFGVPVVVVAMVAGIVSRPRRSRWLISREKPLSQHALVSPNRSPSARRGDFSR